MKMQVVSISSTPSIPYLNLNVSQKIKPQPNKKEVQMLTQLPDNLNWTPENLQQFN